MYKEAVKSPFETVQKPLVLKEPPPERDLYLETLLKESWEKIAPFWPLKNLIAVNPLQGLEELPLEKALEKGRAFFQQTTLPKPMEMVNRVTIKWLQAFFDEGQATIAMPLRQQGLYSAWKKLAYFDVHLHGGNIKKKKWLLELAETPEAAIAACLTQLNLTQEEETLFCTLMLTTLPGWAAYIKYRTAWSEESVASLPSVTQMDYLAIRLIITILLFEEPVELIAWHKKAEESPSQNTHPLKEMEKTETEYLRTLLGKLASQGIKPASTPNAQLVFCIDVRSEPLRRALESRGHYETFGFAGFFGIPIRVNNTVTGELYASCPVLLKPKHLVTTSPCCSKQDALEDYQGYHTLTTLKRLYQGLKYNFTTPFALVELIGLTTGLWMALKTLAPRLARKIQHYVAKKIRPTIPFFPSLANIDFKEQCVYAETALRMMGLTKNFAPLVVFCGHGSATENNAFGTALDCGACGGRHGGSNAQVLANILNDQKVRLYLKEKGISIPKFTDFIAAEHNTTTDDVEFYLTGTYHVDLTQKITQLKEDLKAAREITSAQRAKNMGFQGNEIQSVKNTKVRSLDWAQVRPEWGLARNASFIVAPRALSKNSDLEGRAFLHSYNYEEDPEGTSLTVILTAPMVVAQWINCQYLFSTLDNVAYGAGSKVTKNITGKIGIMQGNASDLMHGLPLQSVNITDTQAYHVPQRLLTLVYAPCHFISKIIEQQPVLQKLFGNGWVRLIAIDKEEGYYSLQRDLTWQRTVNE
jgi:uncharacterized protein YbcC (UPF0753/DUF2309 family)